MKVILYYLKFVGTVKCYVYHVLQFTNTSNYNDDDIMCAMEMCTCPFEPHTQFVIPDKTPSILVYVWHEDHV